jgi:MFS family permease
LSTPTFSSPKLFHRDFSFLVIGQIIMMVGAALLRFALSLYILDTTGRADLFATLYAVSSLPLLLSPVGGAIADRVSRRNLLVILGIANAAVVAGLLAALVSGTPSVLVIGIVMVALGATQAIEMPTVLACVPHLAPAEKLQQANGLINAIASLSYMAAPVVGGMIYGMVGVPALAAFSAAAFAAGAVIEGMIRIPKPDTKLGKDFAVTLAADLKEGFSYVVRQSTVLKCLILAAVLNMLLLPFFIVGVPIVLRQTMNAGDVWYGLGMGLVESGMIIGALLLGVFGRFLALPTLYRWLVGMGLALIPMGVAITPAVLGLGFLPSYALFFVFAMPILISLSMLSIYVVTNVQRLTPDNLMGKVMAIMMAAAQCAAPIGQVVYGVISEQFESAQYVPVLGVAAATVAFAFFARFLLRGETFESQAPAAESLPKAAA